jgi:hypothetical protein
MVKYIIGAVGIVGIAYYLGYVAGAARREVEIRYVEREQGVATAKAVVQARGSSPDWRAAPVPLDVLRAICATPNVVCGADDAGRTAR